MSDNIAVCGESFISKWFFGNEKTMIEQLLCQLPRRLGFLALKRYITLLLRSLTLTEAQYSVHRGKIHFETHGSELSLGRMPYVSQNVRKPGGVATISGIVQPLTFAMEVCKLDQNSNAFDCKQKGYIFFMIANVKLYN